MTVNRKKSFKFHRCKWTKNRFGKVLIMNVILFIIWIESSIKKNTASDSMVMPFASFFFNFLHMKYKLLKLFFTLILISRQQKKSVAVSFIVMLWLKMHDHWSIKVNVTTACDTFKQKRRNSKINYLKTWLYYMIPFRSRQHNCKKNCIFSSTGNAFMHDIYTIFMSVYILKYRYWKKKTRERNGIRVSSHSFVAVIFRVKINESNRRRKKKWAVHQWVIQIQEMERDRSRERDSERNREWELIDR